MKVNRPPALVLGILTLLQLVYFVLAFVAEPAATGEISGLASALAALYLPMVILATGLFLFYVVHALRNKALTRKQRILCVVVFFIANFLAELVYWWSYLWREPAAEAEAGRGGTSGGAISTS
jgi:membrane-anchored protein YejM (alkaline phosphatase superfamily)